MSFVIWTGVSGDQMGGVRLGVKRKTRPFPEKNPADRKKERACYAGGETAGVKSRDLEVGGAL